MSDDIKTIISGVIQFLIAALLGVAAFELYIFSELHPTPIESWIDVVQAVLLLTGAILFALSARREGVRAGGLWLIKTNK